MSGARSAPPGDVTVPARLGVDLDLRAPLGRASVVEPHSAHHLENGNRAPQPVGKRERKHPVASDANWVMSGVKPIIAAALPHSVSHRTSGHEPRGAGHSLDDSTKPLLHPEREAAATRARSSTLGGPEDPEGGAERTPSPEESLEFVMAEGGIFGEDERDVLGDPEGGETRPPPGAHAFVFRGTVRVV